VAGPSDLHDACSAAVLIHAEVSTKRYVVGVQKREYSEPRVRLRDHALLVIAEHAIELSVEECAREISETGSPGLKAIFLL
jgi:hypothetical protein